MMNIHSVEYSVGNTVRIFNTHRWEVRVSVLNEGVDNSIRYACAIDFYDRPRVIMTMQTSPVSKLDAFRLAKQAIYTKMLMRI